MYKDAEAEIARIAELAAKCPADLKVKCFEVLLTGYVQSELAKLKLAGSAGGGSAHEQKLHREGAESSIPAAVLPRFLATAKRLQVSLDKLEALFDFTVDPFALHAVALPDGTSAEKARKVALLVAARSFLATGSWSADWKEVKLQCVDHSCYSANNQVQNLKSGKLEIFKDVAANKAIELSAVGVKEAEKLLKALAETE